MKETIATILYNIGVKSVWNNLLKTINIQQDLWHAIFGHFIVSLIPIPIKYEEYCDAVLNWDDGLSFWGMGRYSSSNCIIMDYSYSSRNNISIILRN